MDEKEEVTQISQQGKKPCWKHTLPAGAISGFLNGLFGSGGGVIAVMFFRKLLKDEKKAHASATLMILFMSIISFTLYSIYGNVEWKTGFMFVPGGLIGAVAGTFILKKINPTKLKKVFAIILIIAGLVMLFS